MIEAAKGGPAIVDGHEMSYGYRDAAAFIAARRAIKRDAAGLAADRSAYDRVVSAGFGLWLDYDWRKKGWNTGDLEKNYFSPERLRDQPSRGDRAIRRIRLDLHGEAAMVVLRRSFDLPAHYVETIRRVRRACRRAIRALAH